MDEPERLPGFSRVDLLPGSPQLCVVLRIFSGLNPCYRFPFLYDDAKVTIGRHPGSEGEVRPQLQRPVSSFGARFDVSHREKSPVKISNRKKIAISDFTKWHRHSCLPRATKGLCASANPKWHRHACLCAFAKPRIRHIEAIASQAPESPQSPRQKFLIANGSRFCISFFRASGGSPHSPPQSRSCLPDKLPSLSGSMLESKTTWTCLRLPRRV
jgi:hypothetical protein